MIQLYDIDTDEPCGTLTDEQFDTLVDALEEDAAEGTEYYIDADVVDMLESGSTDPELVRVLKKALAGREEMQLRAKRA